MNCNCNNENNKTALIKHVFGNVLRLAIPLTLRTVSLEDGEIVSTDTDFIPSNEHPVRVEFTKEKGITKVVIDAVMRDGNVACVEDEGTIPIGTYAITVTCKDNNAKPYRFKQRTVLTVTDYTADAGIQKPVEFEVKEWYLDAAIFLALKGEDGVGIQDIETQTSTEVGGVNTITFILTDGRTRSFTVLNGSGNVDDELDINSRHPLSNSAITTKFNAIDEELANIFGDVDYESRDKVIRFWDKGKTKILAALDATPFIKDGMVNSVYISNNTLVITFNTESGKEPIGVPLTSVFNPNNYYNKTQVDNRIASAVAGVQIDTSGLAQLATNSKLRYNQSAVVILDHINGVEGEDVVYPTSPGIIFGAENGHIILVDDDNEQIDLGITQDIAFYDKTTEAWYRYSFGAGSFDEMGWHQISAGGGSGGGGVSEETDPVFRASVAATITQAMINTWNAKQAAINDLDAIRAGAALGATALQSFTESDPTVPAWAKQPSKPTYTPQEVGALPANTPIPTKTSDLTNDSGFLTQHQSLSGKQDVLVSGENIKTINGNSVLGAGDIDTNQIMYGKLVESPRSAFYPTISYNPVSREYTFSETAVSYLSGIIYVDVLTYKHYMLIGPVLKEIGGADLSNLADVAFSGSYDDLEDKPTIPAAQVNADWNASSGVAQILNKPTIPTVPTNVSAFTNDAGYLTSHQDISGKADKVTVVDVASTGDVSQLLAPNTFYKFGSIDSLALTLTAGTGFVVYAGKFTASSNWGGTELSVPATVTEATGNDTVEAGKVYEFSILDNVISVKEVA